MREILVKLQNIRGDITLIGHLLSPYEAFSTRDGLYVMKLLVKETHEKPQATEKLNKALHKMLVQHSC